MRFARFERTIVAVLLLVHGLLLAWSASRHSPVVDEVAHLPAGVSHWYYGRFQLYRVNPPLVRMVAALPVVLSSPKTEWKNWKANERSRSEFQVGKDFVAVNGQASIWYYIIARWACIPFSLVGGYICFRWARELIGISSGILALTLWCFSPNILAHGQLITPDVAAAALGVAANYGFWRWLRNPSWSLSLRCGVVLGLAELTKATWIILFGLWPIVWIVWGLLVHGNSRSLRVWFVGGRQLILIVCVALYVLNLGYGFEGSCRRLGEYEFVSDSLAGTESSNRFTGTWLSDLPVPLPRNFVKGIDTQKRAFERLPPRPSYLRGYFRKTGWWYYYFYALAVKVPLGTMLLLLLTFVFRMTRRVQRLRFRDEIVLLLPLVVIFTLVSSQTAFSRHLRYILPVFPFAFIWISQVAETFDARFWKLASVVSAAVLLSVASSLNVYPHSLSYFNEFAGGPRRGHDHLLGSNLDWGQDLLYLKNWVDAHPDIERLHLAYYGLLDPRNVGIEFELPPEQSTMENDSDSIQPGWYAVSVNLLRGCPWKVPDGNGSWQDASEGSYAYFQKFDVKARAGYSIYVYQIRSRE